MAVNHKHSHKHKHNLGHNYGHSYSYNYGYDYKKNLLIFPPPLRPQHRCSGPGLGVPPDSVATK